ncbi:17278_t:CDS:1, partial [Funneliformis geosporum]
NKNDTQRNYDKNPNKNLSSENLDNLNEISNKTLSNDSDEI